jgi:hypothetical protein
VLAVRVAAIDLPGFGHGESRVMHCQQPAAPPQNRRRSRPICSSSR